MSAAAPLPDETHRAVRTVTRGMLSLIASRFITIPISLLVNALLARHLGAEDFGAIYLANAGLSLAFLFVDFGTGAQAAAEVARDHSAAPRVLGAGIALRVVLGGLVLVGLPSFTRALGYSETVRMVFMLSAVRTLAGSGAAIAGAVVRGLERITVHARLTVVTAVLDAVILIPVLLLGGGLEAALIAQIASNVAALAAWFVVLRMLGAARMELRGAEARRLIGGGLGFVAFDLAMRLQPYLDAAFLEKLAPPATVGWYAAANRIVGSLLLPATTLNFAIYPSMARLWATDREAFARLTRLGLRVVLLFGTMAAVGAVAFSGLVIRLIYGDGFAPAATDLQVLAGFVALVYLTMLLGCAIAAAERQLIWGGVQALCIPVSLVFDPLLIPFFEQHGGNGGVGVCCAVVLAEVLMVAGGFLLVPRAVLTRSLLADAGRALAAGAAMGGCAWLLQPLPWLAIPASVAAYAGVQAALGGFDAQVVAQLRSVFGGKLRAGAPDAPPAPTA